MTCKTCKFWNADGTQMVIALRGKCSESRADKISERTVFDYSCRYYQRRPTPLAPDEATPCPVCGDDLFRCSACQEAHEKRLAGKA